jgi:protein ImuB
MLWCVLTPAPPDPQRSSAPDTPASPSVPIVPIAPEVGGWPALACWAGNYTSQVSLELAVPALSFEISGSLRLFGGQGALLARIREELPVTPQPLNLAVAPVARGALWLARAGDQRVYEDLSGMRAALCQVPLSVLPWPLSVQERLRGFGFRRLGDLIDLPRAALATRIGRPRVLDLARALGELADPLPWFQFPQRFVQSLELPAPVNSAPTLLFAARRLVSALTGWLAVRMASASVLHWQIAHGRGQPPTCLPLHFSEPVHTPARIERVLKEALDRLPLPAPALELWLTVAQVQAQDARTQTLFAGGAGASAETGLAELIDRLHARLGVAAVSALACQADHRPERASVEGPLTDKGAGVIPYPQVGAGNTAIARPLCLFDTPVALAEHQGRPWRGGALQLLAGPERIESGWWDGDDAVRDYFIAQDRQRCWLWVFRSGGSAPRWFLHGLFS